MLGTLFEGHDSQSQSLADEALEDASVVLDRRATATRSRDNDVSTSSEQTVEDLDTDRALSDTCEQRILVLDGRTGCGDRVQDVDVDTGEVVALLPTGSNLTLEVQKRGLVRRNGSDTRDQRAKEFAMTNGAYEAGRDGRGLAIRGACAKSGDVLVW